MKQRTATTITTVATKTQISHPPICITNRNPIDEEIEDPEADQPAPDSIPNPMIACTKTPLETPMMSLLPGVEKLR